MYTKGFRFNICFLNSLGEEVKIHNSDTLDDLEYDLFMLKKKLYESLSIIDFETKKNFYIYSKVKLNKSTILLKDLDDYNLLEAVANRIYNFIINYNDVDIVKDTIIVNIRNCTKNEFLLKGCSVSFNGSKFI